MRRKPDGGRQRSEVKSQRTDSAGQASDLRPPTSGLNRRHFIRRGALFLPTLFIPRLIQAQAVLTADGLAAFSPAATGGGSGGGGIAKVFDIEAEGTTGGCTTSATNSTGSNLFVAGLGGYRSPFPAASDNQSNSWTVLTGKTNGGGAGAILNYKLSPTTNASHTFSGSGGDVGTNYTSLAALGFSGITALDGSSAGGTAGGSSSQPGSFTPSASAGVLVTVLGWDTGASTVWQINSGFTLLYQNHSGGGLGFAIAYKIKSDALAENPTWSIVSGVSNPASACVMSGFK